MKLDLAKVRKCLTDFEFRELFREHLGWDNINSSVSVVVDGSPYELTAVAQKRGFMVYACDLIPDYRTRRKIDSQVTRTSHEHLIIYADSESGRQLWQWVRREPGKPAANRECRFSIGQTGNDLIQRLERIAISLDEEDQITVVDVASRTRAAFDVDRVTKKFYDRFKSEHTAFSKLIDGIANNHDLQWYSSLMLNRLMFVYFIQKKGFLDGDLDYLRNRLNLVQQHKGPNQFHSFYRYFLLRLFHDGLGKSPQERQLDPTLEKLLGRVPYLNGGFFEVHQLEQHNPEIDIPDQAFQKLFDFFDQYAWHLDERPLRSDNEINPDVVGYIFEKFINQKQMGAYYTKEDITEYISKNTIIPFLFDAAAEKQPAPFAPGGQVWQTLREDPDRYIYPAMRHGVVREGGDVVPESELPEFVQTGLHDPLARMHNDAFNRQQAVAGDPYRLITETWREYMYRRQRCLEIRSRLTGDYPGAPQQGSGADSEAELEGVQSINDLITLNLDIWQFARDVIIKSDTPELLRAFWKAVKRVTVLDPTCGSGAFLFAALKILETLYSDCLARMEEFVEEQTNHGTHHDRRELGDFKEVLGQIAQHPNETYYVLKSIMINNLFGVDIMEEAVEICKLRLFLKLVAQVERVEQIEPLPDIDFNIRSGNTLVGFATLEQVRDSMDGDFSKEADLPRIEEEAELVEEAYKLFREQQTRFGGKVTATDKQNLRDRLETLNARLDGYLAGGEYGIHTNDQAEFEAWKTSHQPFHWLTEFYGTMHHGGFDVIIGNPPYVEYSKVKRDYTIRGYETESCGNLYTFVMERNKYLNHSRGRSGMIVPHSSICTDRMAIVQKLFNIPRSCIWISSYGIRPAKLFTGVEQRLCIYLLHNKTIEKHNYTSSYHRWNEDFRSCLFPLIRYTRLCTHLVENTLQKIDQDIENGILKHLQYFSSIKFSYGNADKDNGLYFHNAPRYWIRAMDSPPYFWNERDGEQVSTQVKKLSFTSKQDSSACVAVLNSALFYWWFIILSDCRHLNLREIENFPVGLSSMSLQHKNKLACLSKDLMIDFDKHKTRKECNYKATGKVIYDEFYPKHSKPIIDEIDKVLAEHYGFTDEELDFIINYDIKYRMGDISASAEENED